MVYVLNLLNLRYLIRLLILKRHMLAKTMKTNIPEANERNDERKAKLKDKGKQKRDTSTKTDPTDSATRLEFDDQRTICNLYLRVDPQLHTEIFNNEGNKVCR